MGMQDPITPLTQAEQDFVNTINTTWTRDQVLGRLTTDLQTAVEIELATIPIYLYTYYSINRNNEIGESMSDAQIFANKAGGVIMSVAVEEMLHMSLSSNILWSMGVMPQLYGNAPAAYPTGLPYHNKVGPVGPHGGTAVEIPLGKLSFEQLWHFLQIEYPEQYDAAPQDSNWDTIGQFYSYIRCLLSSTWLTDADFQQGGATNAIQPYNYSPNNVDTVYPDANFDPWKPAAPVPTPSWADKMQGASEAAVFTDQEDSHAGATQLVTVKSKNDALIAIDTICDQGEGIPVKDKGDTTWDDASQLEDSHYWKFLKLQSQFADYIGTSEQYAAVPAAPEASTPTMTEDLLIHGGYVVNMPESPVAIEYPELYSDIANFTSACFQYMLIMTETVFLVPPENQKVFFNEGLHRSMIWVLDKYIKTIRQLPIPSGPYKGKMMGPTFENVSLGTREHSFLGLAAFGTRAIDAANSLIAMLSADEVVQSMEELFKPGKAAAKAAKIDKDDDDIVGVLQNVIYYIGVAITKTSASGVPMHLPDVGKYWAAQ